LSSYALYAIIGAYVSPTSEVIPLRSSALPDPPAPSHTPPADRPPNLLRALCNVWTLLGVVALLAATESSADVVRSAFGWGGFLNIHGQAAALLGGIALLWFGVWWGTRRWPATPAPRRDLWPRHALLGRMLLAAIVAGALAVRLVGLETGVPRFIDEIHYFEAVTRLWETPMQPLLLPFNPDVTAFSWLYPYAQMHSVALFGANFFAMRAVSAACGALTVWALYLLARPLWGMRVALIAAALLAVLPIHVHFSRLALNNIADPLFGTLALAGLAHALTSDGRGRARWLAFAALMLGMTAYFYEGGRLLFPPLVLLFALVWGIAAGVYVAELRWGQVAAFAFWLCAAMAPLYVVWAAQDAPLLPRMDEMRISDVHILESLAPATWQRLHALVWGPESGWFYFEPLLPPWIALLGVAGALWCVAAVWRSGQIAARAGAIMLLLWLLATAGGNALMRDLWWARYVVVLPCVALLVALAVRTLIDRLTARAITRVVLIVALCGGIGGVHLGDYFGRFQPWYDAHGRAQPDVEEAVLRALTLPRNTQVLIVAPSYYFSSNISTILVFWGRRDLRVTIVQPQDFTAAALPTLLLPTMRAAFFISPYDLPSLRVLRGAYGVLLPRLGRAPVPADRLLLLYVAG
jgi:4-amino-4-deoxy-L-arabinose transferase-like glycosyltransferase